MWEKPISQQKKRTSDCESLLYLFIDLLLNNLLATRKEYFVSYLFVVCIFVGW